MDLEACDTCLNTDWRIVELVVSTHITMVGWWGSSKRSACSLLSLNNKHWKHYWYEDV